MQDLMFMVRIQEEAKRAGLKTIAVKTKADALRRAQDQPLVIFIDLNHDAAEPLALIQDLKRDTQTSSIPLIGFVSHVQTGLRAAAASDGCDIVLPRSSFVQKLPELISSRLPK